MKYSLEPYGDRINIVNLEAKCAIGSMEATGGYRVRNAEGNTIAIVNSTLDAAPALIAHIERHSAWQRDGLMEYFKWTLFGLLQVRQENGSWSVYRQAEFPLMRGDEVATFPTHQEAQHAADAHLDDVKDHKLTNDGLSWFAYEEAN